MYNYKKFKIKLSKYIIDIIKQSNIKDTTLN